MIFYILAAILLLGIMVTVHEFGHFMAARLTGIPVKEFAIGFGPQILSWSSKKHETKFFLRCIPMGGYCAFYGEDDTEEKEKDVVNQFQLRGHGSDKKTKLHEIRHIVMNNHSLSR